MAFIFLLFVGENSFFLSLLIKGEISVFIFLYGHFFILIIFNATLNAQHGAKKYDYCLSFVTLRQLGTGWYHSSLNLLSHTSDSGLFRVRSARTYVHSEIKTSYFSTYVFIRIRLKCSPSLPTLFDQKKKNVVSN